VGQRNDGGTLGHHLIGRVASDIRSERGENDDARCEVGGPAKRLEHFDRLMT